MKRLLSFSVLILLACSQILFAATPSLELTASRLEKLCSLEGLSGPSSFYPYSKKELFMNLPESSSVKTHSLHDAVSTRTEETHKAFSWSIPLKLSLEAYMNSDERYRWEDRLPLLDIPMNFDFGDLFVFRTGFVLKQRYKNVPYGDSFYTNLTGLNGDEFDFFWPYRGYLQVNAPHFSLTAGRIGMSMGPGKTGNLIISDNLNFFDGIVLKFFSRGFQFSTSVQFFSPETEMGTGKRTFEMLIAHRAEFVPFSKLRISLNETIMYCDESFDIRFLNPMVIYHQYFTADLTNSIIGLDFDLNIVKGLDLYGQVAMDQYQLSNENKETPNAFGYQLGLEYNIALDAGILSFWTEFTQTDPWMYHRDGVDYIVWYHYNFGYEKRFIGYPYGCDSQVWAIGAEFDSLSWLICNASLVYSRQGEVNIDSDFATEKNSADRTPTGTPENDLSFCLGAEAGPFWKYCKLYGGLQIHYTVNLDHVIGQKDINVQGSLGVAIEF
ncbi:MAG: capsule assembly Wzi family protein [Sphaerochaetaceae bacterium]|jgi:hypothetical protein|nr:capsule assembly Wzi family protein [Sphaerochaetaceae bacterium]MDD3163403.1 capsule assembly Wzi family protein [Sphaerochaetaceae bacterium]MDD4008107.1 capsule assembly Wzi family protein [Sphaerochaetaceae bacterium]MDD4397240.1 capsule assembly Wzi family protein [Sphaerochaetaceae bacterium]